MSNCPWCNSPYLGAERARELAGGMLELYRWCPVCHKTSRSRMSTKKIEGARGNLARWRRRAERQAGSGRVSSVAERAVALQMDALRVAAMRAGLVDQVPELCQQPSESPSR